MFLNDFWFSIFMRYIEEDERLIRYSYLIDSDDESLAGKIEFEKSLFISGDPDDPELLEAFIDEKAKIVQIGKGAKFLTEDGFDFFVWLGLVLLHDEYKRLGGFPEDAGFLNTADEEKLQENEEVVKRVLAKKSDSVKPS